MTNQILAALTVAASLGATLNAAEGPVPSGIPHLDHAFVIVMENHGYAQIVNNPNALFINMLGANANLAVNYFAIAHPSLPNYLEIAGGSNFGILNDNDPDWHNQFCMPNLASATTAFDNGAGPDICLISGTGTDAATPVVDTSNEASGPPGVFNIDGVQSIPAATNISAKTIADQLAAAGLTWKSYQESLPSTGADFINYSDGYFSNLTDFSALTPVLNPPLTNNDLVPLYTPKHNPFVYFRSIQEAEQPGAGLDQVVGFVGSSGLFADLGSGNVPSFSFIVPNQCNDQHGRSGAGPYCDYDPENDGTQAGLNPALILRGDVTVKMIVTAIKQSPVWSQGQNAIILLWDENDFSPAPNTNQVVLIVDTSYGPHGIQSASRYTHFSLLKSLESGLGLPCLNHACDANVDVIADLFAAQ